jgi:glucosylceramidase
MPVTARLLLRGLRASLRVCFLAGAAGIALAQGQATGSVDLTTSLNRVDGFGFSAAFGQAETLRKLDPKTRAEVLNLLFGRDGGAGLNIVRLGIDTGTTIEPADPGGPSAAPKYVFDGSDGGQVWLAQAAQRFGVATFTADAWTAPAFMKTNQKVVGGSLCGLAETHCAADWTRAFADYLLRYVGFYRDLLIPIDSLGFANEPDINVSYESMLFTPAQAVEFLNTFGPVVRQAAPGLRITCCDASKWTAAEQFQSAIEGDPAKQFVDLVAAHEYGAHAVHPLVTDRPVWMTEWSSGLARFEPRWDCNGCFAGPDGMYLAQDIIQAFRDGNINAYVFWWAAADAPAALIHLTKDGYSVGKRFYALAMISRFVRPGAVRVDAQTADADLQVVAFRNPSGEKVLTLLNTSRLPKQVAFSVDAATADASARTFLTDDANAMVETDSGQLAGRVLRILLPKRSMTTICLSPAAKAGVAKIAVAMTLQRLNDGSYQARLRAANSGPNPVGNVRLEHVSLGKTEADAEAVSGISTDLPHALGTIAAGGFADSSAHLGAAAGRPGKKVEARFAGTYAGGTFSEKTLVVLP